MSRWDVIIIGGGASGLCAAISAARHGDRVLVIEKYNHPGKKLLATGNGRCNLMNLNLKPYGGDTEFAYRVLGSAPVEECIDFWRGLGLEIRFDTEGRGYPCTFQASTVLEVLKAECYRLNVTINNGEKVLDVRKSDTFFQVYAAGSRDFYEAGRVICCNGGAAQPALGGNQSAWPWLECFGHTFKPPRPSLTSLRTDERSVSGLAGIRVKCAVTVLTNGKAVYQESGELLFTKEGISGICVMQCSRFVTPGVSICEINLFPDLYDNTAALERELQRRQCLEPEGEPPGLLRGLCVPKLAFAVCKQAGLALRGEQTGSLSSGEIRKIAGCAMGYRVRVSDADGFERAQVMAGGVRCAEFSPENMESRLCPGLHVAGELLDVDGDCGGYNLMFAFLSGIRAGENGRSAR